MKEFSGVPYTLPSRLRRVHGVDSREQSGWCHKRWRVSKCHSLPSFHLTLEVRTRSEPGSTLRSSPLTLGPRTCKYGSGLPHRTEPRTCGFGSVRTLVQKGPDRTVDSVCITPHLDLHTMPQVTLTAAHTIIPHLLAPNRSYMSPRTLDDPLWHIQRLDLPSSTSMHYREKHRSTQSLHQMVQTTFRQVGSGHRRPSNIAHPSEHQKQCSEIPRTSFTSTHWG